MQRYVQDHFRSLLIPSLLPTTHTTLGSFTIMHQHYRNLITLPKALAPTLLSSVETQQAVLISSLKTH